MLVHFFLFSFFLPLLIKDFFPEALGLQWIVSAPVIEGQQKSKQKEMQEKKQPKSLL